MNKKIWISLIVVCVSLQAIGTGCDVSASSDDSSSNSNTQNGGSGGNNSGSGGTFTGSDLNGGSWAFNGCQSGNGGITGATRYTTALQITGGNTFNFQQQWYSSSNCAGGSQVVEYDTGGTFTLGGLISGSSTLQSIQFTIASDASSMTLTGSTAQSSGNSGCTPTGSFTGSNGYDVGTFNLACGSLGITLPNSGNAVVNNVIGFSNNVISLGAIAVGIPGVFNGNTVPTTTSLNFSY